MQTIPWKEIECSIGNLPEIELLAKRIADDGYAIIENVIGQESIDRLLADSAIASPRVNSNRLGTVYSGDVRFLTNVIAVSRDAYSIVTSRFVLDLCKVYFKKGFRLVNNRIQATIANVAMPWHTDNNLLQGGKLVGRHNLPGLQFVIYLTDINASPFQLIRNSQHWSHLHQGHYLTSSEAEKYGSDIVELRPPMGSLLILNTHAFHRAAPISRRDYRRAILLFQVDEISEDLPEHGEKMYLNPDFMSDFNMELATFLGFGCNRAYPAFPDTSASNIGPREILPLQLMLFSQLLRSWAKHIAKVLLPASLIVTAKNRMLSGKYLP